MCLSSFTEKPAKPNHDIPNGHSNNQLMSQINVMLVMSLVLSENTRDYLFDSLRKLSTSLRTIMCPTLRGLLDRNIMSPMVTETIS
jgi:hypothetical protein